jgi:macrolide phosphotransferase
VLAAIAANLPVRVPEPVYVAGPSRRFPLGVAGYALVEGTPLGSVPPLTSAEATRLGQDVGRFLAALHAAPDRLAREAGLPSLGPTEIAADLARLRSRLPDWSGAPEWIGEALEQCAAELAGPLPEALVHDDLHGAHVLVDDERHLTGVIDWGELKGADPARDLLFFLPAGPRVLEALLETYGQPDPAGLLRRAYWYRLHRAAAQIAEALERALANFLPIAEQRLHVWRRLPPEWWH